MEKLVGRISHFFPKISVAVVELVDEIERGDEIQISGTCTNFKQVVGSIQAEHKDLEKAGKGMAVGMHVVQEVHKGDSVYKLS